jgi:large subunit ribosomal protein L15
MNLLQRTTPNKKAKTVGRGSKRGKTSGRGTKGQKARAGHKIRPEIRDRIKKLPKLRGRGKNINKAFRTDVTVVNLSVLAKAFAASDAVSPSKLLEKGLIRRTNGKVPAVKILAGGEISQAVTVYDCEVSAAAKAKIEAAGGSVKGSL